MNPIITELEAEVARNTQVVASAIVLIEGIAARVQAGIDAALEAGATAAQLETLVDEVADLKSGSTALAAAVAANTPGGPVVEPPPEARSQTARGVQPPAKPKEEAVDRSVRPNRYDDPDHFARLEKEKAKAETKAR